MQKLLPFRISNSRTKTEGEIERSMFQKHADFHIINSEISEKERERDMESIQTL